MSRLQFKIGPGVEGSGGFTENGIFLIKNRFLTKTINFFSKIFFSKNSWGHSTHDKLNIFQLYALCPKLIFPTEFTLSIVNGHSWAILYGPYRFYELRLKKMI